MGDSPRRYGRHIHILSQRSGQGGEDGHEAKEGQDEHHCDYWLKVLWGITEAIVEVKGVYVRGPD